MKSRENAIRHALSNYLTKDQVEKALLYWVKNYSSQPKYLLQGYAKDISSMFNIQQYRVELLKQMLQNLERIKTSEVDAVKSLSANSARDVNVVSQVAGLDQLGGDPKLKAFNLLLNELRTYIPAQYLSAAQKQLMLEIHNTKLKLSFEQKRSWQDWVKEGTYLPKRSGFNDKSYKIMMSCMYNCLCLFVGPVQADKAILNSIQKLAGEHGDIDESVFKEFL